jgi:hypothetical protein
MSTPHTSPAGAAHPGEDAGPHLVSSTPPCISDAQGSEPVEKDVADRPEAATGMGANT